MKKTVLNSVLALAFLVGVPASAIAGPATDALSACLSDGTTGKDRKALAKWIFAAMSVHPELKDVANTSVQARLETDRMMGSLVTKLLAETCPAEARAAIEAEGSQSFGVAFETLGKLAVQELMTDPSVTASVANFAKYLDEKKFEEAFSKNKPGNTPAPKASRSRY